MTKGKYKSPFNQLGYAVREYRYWNHKMLGLNFDGMKEDIIKAPENSIIMLQTGGHVPTGCDINTAQWYELADIIKSHNLFPFFMMSFQGMITGDLDSDAFPIRLFVKKGIEFFTAQSYESKFGMYCILNVSR